MTVDLYVHKLSIPQKHNIIGFVNASSLQNKTSKVCCVLTTDHFRLNTNLNVSVISGETF